MKKALALCMTAALLLALCVPSFAASPLKPNSSTDSSSKIVTDTSNLPSPDGDFTVTFPAETKIVWGAESTNIEQCSYESHLVQGKRLQITVKSSDASQMTPVDSTIQTKLAYTLDGQKAVTAAQPNVFPAVAFVPTVQVSADQWNYAVVGEYQDTLTFTAEVVSA